MGCWKVRPPRDSPGLVAAAARFAAAVIANSPPRDIPISPSPSVLAAEKMLDDEEFFDAVVASPTVGPPPKVPFYAVDRSTDDSTVESQGFRDPAPRRRDPEVSPGCAGSQNPLYISSPTASSIGTTPRGSVRSANSTPRAAFLDNPDVIADINREREKRTPPSGQASPRLGIAARAAAIFRRRSMGSPRNNAPPSKFDTGSFSFRSKRAPAPGADPASTRPRPRPRRTPAGFPAARSDFEELRRLAAAAATSSFNAEDAVRAAAAKIGAKVAPPSTTVDVDVETK